MGFFLGQICLGEAVQSGSRGTGDYPAFLLITSVWESYADEKSRILIGKLTHLEIREYVSSPTKPTLGLRLQFPRGNSLACILHWTAKNNDFRCKTKEFSQKAVFKVKGTIWSWNESWTDSQGRAEWGGAHSEITSIWSLCLRLFPLFLLLSIYLLKDEKAKKVSGKQTAIREAIEKIMLRTQSNFIIVKNEVHQGSRILWYWNVWKIPMTNLGWWNQKSKRILGRNI